MPKPHEDLDAFIGELKLAAEADVSAVTEAEPLTAEETDRLFGLKFSEGYSGRIHEWPSAANGLESAGRRATTEEEKKQRKVYPADDGKR